MKAPGALHAVILAAGTASRFGGGKVLAPWKGGLLIHAVLDAAAAAPVAGLTVVTGADALKVETVVRDWARDQAESRLTLVHAPDYREGLAASLRTGIRALPASAGGAFIFLGDMPRIPLSIPSRLPQALEGGRLASVPTWKGRRGHPVLLTRALFPEIMSLSGELGDRLGEVPADDDGILFDVDEVKDLESSAFG
jgi:molybdenum cofactor cytidylyltransferase